MGDVQIDLVEPDFPGNQSDDVKNLAPNQTAPKNPHIVNTGVNEKIVFFQLSVPMCEVTQVDTDGQKLEEQTLQDVFRLVIPESNPEKLLSKQVIGETENNWVLLSKDVKETETEYIFGYTEKLLPESEHTYKDNDVNKDGSEAQPGTQTTALFLEATLKNIIEGEIRPNNSLDIKLSAYAIQPESVLDENDADLTETLNYDNLKKIFTAFATQNKDNPVPEAKDHNEYGIPDGKKLTTKVDKRNKM